jgi:hypothetical protein
MNELCQKVASKLICGAQPLSASLLGSEVDNKWRGQTILPLIEVSTLVIDLSRELFCMSHQVDGNFSLAEQSLTWTFDKKAHVEEGE